MAITITFSVAGSFTIEDDGTPGNATSIVRRDSDGVILAIIPHPADSLTFRAIVPGVNLTLNVTDSFGTAALTVGSLTNAAETPDSIVVRNIESSSSVTLVSNGSISEDGSDLTADIVASSIILSAISGVGTPGNAIETQTTAMEAETTTGGINISNAGNLQVGGLSADVDGLDVVTSGNIRLTNLGSITLSDETSFDSVHGGETSGDVTLIANGYDSDITSNVDQSSIIATRGSVFLTASRDVSFGLGGADFGNDVRANGSIVVDAGRDFLLSGFADFFADGVLGTSGGNLIVNAGRNISLLDDTGSSASLAVLGSGGGDVILTTGANGLVTLEAPSTNTLSSGSGSVIVNADRIFISASSGITAAADVTLRPVSEGRGILLGSLSDGGAALELSDGELDRIFSETLILGSNSTGRITVGAPIAPGSVENFTLRSGADIFANSSLTAANTLSLFAGDNIYQLGGSVFAGATFNAAVDDVDGDNGTGGVAVLLGTVTATDILVNGNHEADTLSGVQDVDQIVHGNGGNDTITSSGEGNYFGDDGDDRISAGLSSGLVPEILDGGAGTDTLDTTSFTGSYTINLTTGASNFDYETFLNFENLITGDGNDMLTGTSAGNIITSGSGDDTLDGGAGIDRMYGGLGNDLYYADSANDRAFEDAGEGLDTVRASSDTYTLRLNVENLVMIGDARTGLGNDLVNVIRGNAVDNVLLGRGGNDTIRGEDGADRLYGQDGNDILRGDAGDDVIDGGTGSDTMRGGAGDDVYFVREAADVVLELAGEGHDLVKAYANHTLSTDVENLSMFGLAVQGTGNSLDNVIRGTNAVNTISGLGGADTLRGFGGADTIEGGDGNDRIYGGAGEDILTGGAGADQFRFDQGDLRLRGAAIEAITDFSRAQGDRLNLSGIDANANVSNDQSFTFLGSSAFTGSAGELRHEQDGTDTFVYGDTNGDGLADFQFKLDGLVSLQAGDFVL